MKFYGIILGVVVLMAPVAATAKVEQCRHIGNRIEREACYKRQDEARAAAQKAADSKSSASASDTLDKMKAENDRVSSKLKGICRNC